MAPLVQYDPAIPSPPINLLESGQSGVTAHRKSWLKAQWAISPYGFVANLIVVIVGVQIHSLLREARANTWVFWWNVSVFVILTLGLSRDLRHTIVTAPKIWSEKAHSASTHLDEGGIVLVLASNVGASAIPFAEQVMHRGVEKNIVFVCIDRFMARYSWPYSPVTLLNNLSAVGIPSQSIIAHKATNRWGCKDSPGSLIQYDQLPFQSNSISLVIADQAQYEYIRGWFSEHNGKIYDEVVRVLQPGGRAIMSEFRDVKHLIPDCEAKGWKVEWRAGRHWFEFTKNTVPADIKLQDNKADIEKAI